MNQLYTVDEAAALLRVSRRTLYREIAAGYLRTIRIGRRRLVTDQEITAYLAAKRRAA